MDICLSSNNTRQYLDVSGLAKVMGPDLSATLLALHTFTGCDYTASFIRKIQPLQIMERSKSFLSAIGKFRNSQRMPPTVLKETEIVVCSMYGKRNLRSISDVRVALFWQSNVPCRRANPLQKIRCKDPRLLPPCKAELLEKRKRTNYVPSMWENVL